MGYRYRPFLKLLGVTLVFFQYLASLTTSSSEGSESVTRKCSCWPSGNWSTPFSVFFFFVFIFNSTKLQDGCICWRVLSVWDRALCSTVDLLIHDDNRSVEDEVPGLMTSCVNAPV